MDSGVSDDLQQELLNMNKNNLMRLIQIKKEALRIVQETHPEISSIKDLFDIDEDGAYICLVWDYPGAYYPMAVHCKDDHDFARFIAKETILRFEKHWN